MFTVDEVQSEVVVEDGGRQGSQGGHDLDEVQVEALREVVREIVREEIERTLRMDVRF